MERSNRIPLSLADLKRKKEEEKNRNARPVFLSKTERQKVESQQKLTSQNSKGERPTKRKRTTRFENVNDSNQIETIERKPTEEARQALRSQYLEKPISKRNRVQNRPNQDKHYLQFAWDNKDDTMHDEDAESSELRKLTSGSSFYVSQTRTNKLDVLMGAHHRGRNAKNAHLYDQRHWSEKQRDEMTARDWRIFREDYLITVRSSITDAPLPARNWEETGLSGQLQELIHSVARYGKPSPIQMAAIPIGVASKDCIGLAETGSGKTAAFVLPLLSHISLLPPITPVLAARGPYALILAPTRELALQIEEEALKFAQPLGFRVVHIIGGQELDIQAMQLESGCEIVVCTPGRMVDLLSRQMAALGNCQYLVLDEADRMIDMGFEPQLADVLAAMPAPLESGKPSRQTFMFSATMSPSVERIAKTYLHDPVVIAVGETNKAADNVVQKVSYFATENRRRERFYEFLETLESPILVFVNTRKGCEMVYHLVEKNVNIRTAVMHS